MAIVIDTNILWYPDLLDRLAERDVVVPVVVLLERARQLLQRESDPFEFLHDIERLGWRVAPYDTPHAIISACMAPLEDAKWTRLARDVMIAAHVGGEDELWTVNAKDFVAIGLPSEQVVDPTA